MKTTLLLGASALALGACASSPTPLPSVETQQATASANAPITHTGYQNPLAGFQSRAPSEPRPWRDVNDEQSEGN
ncbi:MAG: starvation-inducible outer membrane lipoprotein [Paracoccaceae bacterium]|jgi:starvation-inducible outer membrane lipoprotein